MNARLRGAAWAFGATLLAAGAGLWWRFGDTVFVAALGGWLC